MSLLRRPANPHGDPPTARVLKFMTEGNHPSYEQEISELQDHFEEVQAEAGPQGYLCPVTQERLDGIDKEIWDIAQAAVERYDDWASDPLP